MIFGMDIYQFVAALSFLFAFTGLLCLTSVYAERKRIEANFEWLNHQAEPDPQTSRFSPQAMREFKLAIAKFGARE